MAERPPLPTLTDAATVRAHWTIENRLHWVMDVVFHDDLCRLRTGHAPHNMPTVRQITLNAINAINAIKAANDGHISDLRCWT